MYEKHWKHIFCWVWEWNAPTLPKMRASAVMVMIGETGPAV